MDKSRAIELLKQYLTEMPGLRKLHYDNQDFELWVSKIENIIKAALAPEDYVTFHSAYPHSIPIRGIVPESAFIEHYQEDITMKETALKKIIQKYEILGLDKETATKTGETPITRVEQTVIVVSPIQLFDKMQFHPKVIEASRELFKDGYYRDAILRAFIAVNNFVKEKTSLELDGKALMAQVFKKEKPVIKLNELRNQTEKDEQEGFMFLFMGAMVGIRNPKAHDNIIQTDPYRTLEYLALASLLMRRAEEGELAKTTQQRKQWNLQRFLIDASEKCSQEVVDTINKLYDFTKKYSDSISWGTGVYWGSFTFRKSWRGIKASVFTVYSDSSLTINFGQMKGRDIEEEALESLRVELNRIPEIKIPRDAVTIGKWHDISVDPLVNAKHLDEFQDAVLALCQQIESSEQ